MSLEMADRRGHGGHAVARYQKFLRESPGDIRLVGGSQWLLSFHMYAYTVYIYIYLYVCNVMLCYVMLWYGMLWYVCMCI